MNKRVNISVALILMYMALGAQDVHFSQIYLSPIIVNPAETGNIKENLRFSCQYKDQWHSISGTYKTILASADVVLKKRKNLRNTLAIGAYLYNDKAGKSNFGTTSGNFITSYHFRVNKYNYFGLGASVGFNQRSANFSNLKWDAQFNGESYDPSLSSGEQIQSIHYTFLDVNSGVLWKCILNDRQKFDIGIGLFHLNTPDLNGLNTEKLKIKTTLKISGEFKVGEKNSSFIPLMYLAIQGKQKEINIGTIFKYDLGLDSRYTGLKKSSSLSLGALYRVQDALILLWNYDYHNRVTIGFSYDINISRLIIASKGRGGLELCFKYLI